VSTPPCTCKSCGCPKGCGAEGIARDDLEARGEPEEMEFTKAGNLADLPLPDDPLAPEPLLPWA
jgi:hypothetical protein